MLASLQSLPSLPEGPGLASLPSVPSLPKVPKAAGSAAFGVFFGLEVLDFDRFLTFFCCHIIFLSGWFVLCQEHRRLIDARL